MAPWVCPDVYTVRSPPRLHVQPAVHLVEDSRVTQSALTRIPETREGSGQLLRSVCLLDVIGLRGRANPLPQ